MKEKDPIVKGLERALELLPKDLTEEEKEKVAEIEELLKKIENKENKTVDNER